MTMHQKCVLLTLALDIDSEIRRHSTAEEIETLKKRRAEWEEMRHKEKTLRNGALCTAHETHRQRATEMAESQPLPADAGEMDAFTFLRSAEQQGDGVPVTVDDGSSGEAQTGEDATAREPPRKRRHKGTGSSEN